MKERAEYAADQRAPWRCAQDGSYDAGWPPREPCMSLKLIRRTAVARAARVLDIGGGASTLADALVRDGFTAVAVLDIAPPCPGGRRFEECATKVQWIVADVTRWRPENKFDLWHDRAVLRRLAAPAQRAAYVAALRTALAPGGWAIIADAASGEGIRCSGLEAARAGNLARLMGPGFALMETHLETQAAPGGPLAPLRYHVFAATC